MSTIIKTQEGLFVHHRGRIDYVWVVKPTQNGRKKKKNSYGIITTSFIIFPPRFVGKKFRIKLEEVKPKCKKKK